MIIALQVRAAALAALVGCLALLIHSAAIIPAPPTAAAELEAWWTRTDPLLAAASLLRLGAVALCGWLALVTAIDTVAVVTRGHVVHRLVQVVAPRAWRVLVLRPIAVGALAAPQVLLPVAAMAPAAAVVIDDTGAASHPVVTMSRHRPAQPAESATPPTITMQRTQVSPPATDDEATTHTIAPGENLWSITVAHLSRELDRRPTTDEIIPYWHELIARNRSTLPDPTNPDLVYAGIVLRLPPVG